MKLEPRLNRPETIQELVRQLGSLFPQATVRYGPELPCPLDGHGSDDPGRILVSLVAQEHVSGAACEIMLERGFDANEARFIRFFARVFNEDVKTASRWRQDEELWFSLQQTRLARVIARFTPFHTTIFLKWLRTLENATSLRYEGQPFATQLVLTKSLDTIRESAGLDYVRFSDRMSLTRALFEEKWTRALAAHGDLALVGLGRDKGIVGIAHPHPEAAPHADLVAPHSGLEPFCSMLVPGTLGFIASRQGDLRILLSSGVTFMKSQGRWSLVNLRLLESSLAQTLDPVVAAAVTRLAADLSFEGQGALLCCIDDPGLIADMVPDHLKKDRVGRALRLMNRNLNLGNQAHQKILRRVATIDGAIVFARDGTVLDSASMISDPSQAILAEEGLSERARFAGARSAAAWNASLYGVAVKVSEDGPITVFRRGQLILQL